MAARRRQAAEDEVLDKVSIKDLQYELDTVNRARETCKMHLDAEKEEQQVLLVELDKVKLDLRQYQHDCKIARQEADVVENQMDSVKQNVWNSQCQLAAFQDEKLVLKGKAEVATKESQMLQAQCSASVKEMQASRAKLHHAQQEVSQLRTEVARLETDKANLIEQKKLVDVKTIEMRDLVRAFDHERHSLRTEIRKVRNEQRAHEARVTAYEQARRKLQNELSEMRHHKRELQDKVALIRSQDKTLRNQICNARTQNSNLRQIVEDLEEDNLAKADERAHLQGDDDLDVTRRPYEAPGGRSQRLPLRGHDEDENAFDAATTQRVPSAGSSGGQQQQAPVPSQGAKMAQTKSAAPAARPRGPPRGEDPAATTASSARGAPALKAKTPLQVTHPSEASGEADSLSEDGGGSDAGSRSGSESGSGSGSSSGSRSGSRSGSGSESGP